MTPFAQLENRQEYQTKQAFALLRNGVRGIAKKMFRSGSKAGRTGSAAGHEAAHEATILAQQAAKNPRMHEGSRRWLAEQSRNTKELAKNTAEAEAAGFANSGGIRRDLGRHVFNNADNYTKGIAAGGIALPSYMIGNSRGYGSGAEDGVRGALEYTNAQGGSQGQTNRLDSLYGGGSDYYSAASEDARQQLSANQDSLVQDILGKI